MRSLPPVFAPWSLRSGIAVSGPGPTRRALLRGLLAAGAGFVLRPLPDASAAVPAALEDLPPPGSPTIAGILRRQRLRAALLVGFAPFASIGPDTDEVLALAAADPPPVRKATDGRKLIGLDADLAAAVAQVLGVRLELTPVERFDDLFMPLGRGDVDLALGGISRTAARAISLAFSSPYLTSGQEVLCLDERRFQTLHEVNSPAIRVGVRDGSTGEAFARRDLARSTLRVYPRMRDVFQGFASREVDVCVTDGLVGRDFALRRKLTIYSVERRRVTSEAMAMVARQGDPDFVSFLSLLIRDLRQSGEFMRLARRYNPWLRVDR